MKRLPLMLSLLAVIALSASVAYWVLELYKPPQRPLAAISEAALPEPSPDAAATLFGGQALAVVASNYQLTGVVAAGAEGVAILVADGQPPKALKVGHEFSSGVVLQEVHPKYVMLSEGGILKRIDLATDDKAGTSLALAAPMGSTPMPPPQPQPAPPPAQNSMTGGDSPPPQQIPNPMQVPDMSGSVPVPPPQPGQPTEPQPGQQGQPQGVPPPPPPAQMPAPTRNMSGNPTR
ncbi:type II secretion system protein N [Massilia sp. CF038]|uniref:type II secretion system protein N n=1 Tax=Massilia sp. CF038 TaxID=1881045 RepID=UPI00091B06AE|nr:type II secretion system protein N [Massilia sp. CF038]SHH39856.1 general secretion pathway protein C [Massilia sp. CF038]